MALMHCRSYFIMVSVGLVVAGLDQLTKWLALSCIPAHKPVIVIPGFFDLVNVRNRGAAFGFLNRPDIEWQFWLFLAASIIAVWALFVLVKSSPHRPLLYWSSGLILGGALGNMIDRIRFRAVTDFLDFYYGPWHWPAFNVADIGISCGVLLACIAIWRKNPGQQERQ